MKFSYSIASLALFLDISKPTWAKIIKKPVRNGVRGGDEDARPKEADLDVARARSRFFEDFEVYGKNGCKQFTIESNVNVIEAGVIEPTFPEISASNLFPFWNEGDFQDDDSIIVDNPPAGSYSANIAGGYWRGANDDEYADCSYTGQFTFIDDFDSPSLEDTSLITVSGTCATAGAFSEVDTDDYGIPEEGFAVITGGFGEYNCATGFVENVSEGGDDPLVKVQFNVCKTGCLGLNN